MQQSSGQTTSMLLMKIADTVMKIKSQPATMNFLSGQIDPVLEGIFTLLANEKLGLNWEKVILIGCSAGGNVALRSLFSHVSIPHLPIIIVMHHRPGFSFITRFEMKNSISQVTVDLTAHQVLLGSRVYFLKDNESIRFQQSSKTIDLILRKTRTNFRPDIDEVFTDISSRLGKNTVGIILSGMLSDGAKGLRDIADNQGEVWIQEPGMALFNDMPLAALKAVPNANVGTLMEIGNRINQLSQNYLNYASV